MTDFFSWEVDTPKMKTRTSLLKTDKIPSVLDKTAWSTITGLKLVLNGKAPTDTRSSRVDSVIYSIYLTCSIWHKLNGILRDSVHRKSWFFLPFCYYKHYKTNILHPIIYSSKLNFQQWLFCTAGRVYTACYFNWWQKQQSNTVIGDTDLLNIAGIGTEEQEYPDYHLQKRQI